MIRTLKFVYRAVSMALLLYAVYSAIIGAWARATFFLVLYHICLHLAIGMREAWDQLRKEDPLRIAWLSGE
jgi:succinate dehydrogenase hydrophobic anchor subunit